MGWTFDEFDNTSMLDVMETLEVWKIMDMHEKGKQ